MRGTAPSRPGCSAERPPAATPAAGRLVVADGAEHVEDLQGAWAAIDPEGDRVENQPLRTHSGELAGVEDRRKHVETARRQLTVEIWIAAPIATVGQRAARATRRDRAAWPPGGSSPRPPPPPAPGRPHAPRTNTRARPPGPPKNPAWSSTRQQQSALVACAATRRRSGAVAAIHRVATPALAPKWRLAIPAGPNDATAQVSEISTSRNLHRQPSRRPRNVCSWRADHVIRRMRRVGQSPRHALGQRRCGNLACAVPAARSKSSRSTRHCGDLVGALRPIRRPPWIGSPTTQAPRGDSRRALDVCAKSPQGAPLRRRPEAADLRAMRTG